MAKFGIALIIIGIFIAASLYYLVDSPNMFLSSPMYSEHLKMIHEVFKFSVTGILVGGAALFYKNISENKNIEREEQFNRETRAQEKLAKRAEERAANRVRQEQFFQEFANTYNKIKFLRRELSKELGEIEDNRFIIESTRFNKIMRSLSIGQLELEKYRRLSECNMHHLKPISGVAYDGFRKAEKYLRKVTRDYQNSNFVVAGDGKLYIDSTSAVYEFVGSRRANPASDTAHNEFFKPLDKVFFALGKIIGEEASDQPLNA